MCGVLAALVAVLCLAGIVAGEQQLKLRDPPLLGDGPTQQLDGTEWTARSFGGDGAVTLAATVPGDLVTDLEHAGIVGDPLRDVNWRDQAGAWERPGGWSYTRLFAVGHNGNGADEDGGNGTSTGTGRDGGARARRAASATSTLLVLDGIKMAADVYLNGVLLSGDGVVDQHLRYEYEVGPLLVQTNKPSSNTSTSTNSETTNTNGSKNKNNLTIHFPTPSSDPRNDEGRYMACSGGK